MRRLDFLLANIAAWRRPESASAREKAKKAIDSLLADFDSLDIRGTGLNYGLAGKGNIRITGNYLGPVTGISAHWEARVIPSLGATGFDMKFRIVPYRNMWERNFVRRHIKEFLDGDIPGTEPEKRVPSAGSELYELLLAKSDALDAGNLEKVSRCAESIGNILKSIGEEIRGADLTAWLMKGRKKIGIGGSTSLDGEKFSFTTMVYPDFADRFRAQTSSTYTDMPESLKVAISCGVLGVLSGTPEEKPTGHDGPRP